MRKFSSYGPIDTDLHYYAPRQALVDQALTNLLGENPIKGGHYITVWAPRQRGKTWIFQQVFHRLRSEPRYREAFDVVYVPLEYLKGERDSGAIAQALGQEITRALDLPPIAVREMREIEQVFSPQVLRKPLILVLDEFDSLIEEAISSITGVLRNIYIRRQIEADRPTGEK